MVWRLDKPSDLAEPGALLAEMRAEGPLVRVKMPFIGSIWMTTDDATARRILKDSVDFARSPDTDGGRAWRRITWWMPPFMRPLMQTMITADGERHDRLRGAVDRAFARHSIYDMRPELDAIADGLLDEFIPDTTVDLKSAYARSLPFAAICALLGLPQEDRAHLSHWLSPVSGGGTPWQIIRAFPGLWRVLRYLRGRIAVAETEGGVGLLPTLAKQPPGERLDEDELLSMLFLLFLAGHETTVHLITLSLWSIARDPALAGRLRAEPASIPLAVEEFLRFWSPVGMTKPMIALREVTVDGVTVAKGEMVSAGLLAANHDPLRVEAPSELRPDRRPNAHLGFGFGPHVCLGMQLARLETEVALTRLLDRFEMTLVEEPSFIRRPGLRGLTSLKVRLSSRD